MNTFKTYEENKVETFVRRDHYKNLVAETRLKLTDDRMLDITTKKNSSGLLSTSASSCIKEGEFATFKVFQDFMKTYIRQKVRVTEKALLAQHNSVDFEAIFNEAIEFYKAKEND